MIEFNRKLHGEFGLWCVCVKARARNRSLPLSSILFPEKPIKHVLFFK